MTDKERQYQIDLLMNSMVNRIRNEIPEYKCVPDPPFIITPENKGLVYEVPIIDKNGKRITVERIFNPKSLIFPQGISNEEMKYLLERIPTFDDTLSSFGTI